MKPGTGTSLDKKSVFELGSVSKSFTGILLAELADEVPGMTVDDPLSKYLPELTGTFSEKMTLRQLATHTSGLPRMPCTDPKISYCFHPKDPSNPYVDYTAKQLLDYLKSFSRPDPGPYAAEYSNTGTAVLGYALTRITKKSFDDLLAEKITIPLGMSDTIVERPASWDTSRVANFLNGYDIDRSEIAHWEWDVFAPAGGILSTADDMMKYLAANISPSATPLGDAMKKSQALGLGWDSAPGATMIWKNGQTSGFHNILLFFPKQGTGLFVLGNIGSSYSDYVGLMPLNISMPTLTGISLPESELQSYVGKYRSTQNSTVLEVTKPSKFLIITAPDGKLRLDATSDTDFNAYDGLHEDGYHKVSYEKQPDGKVSDLVLHLNDGKGNYQDVHFTRE